jgi:hypothetical protein
MTKQQITVWPESDGTWIVSRDDESSDTLAVFQDRAQALGFARDAAEAHGLPLYQQDEHGVPSLIAE